MKVLVLTAAVQALVSTAVLAASEGGDTWADLQQIQRAITSQGQSAPRVDSSQQRSHAAMEGSEGGDTWSSLQAVRETGVEQGVVHHRPEQIGTSYASENRGSEGGDTWSRFVPRLERQSTNNTGLSALPPTER